MLWWVFITGKKPSWEREGWRGIEIIQPDIGYRFEEMKFSVDLLSST